METIPPGLKSKLPRFSRFKLRTKIVVGFLAIGLTLVAVVVLANISLNSLFSEFNRFTASSQNVEAGLQLSTKMVELQRLSENFIQDGEGSAARQVDYVFAQAKSLLSRMENGKGKWNASDTGRLERHLEHFYEAFSEVKNQRDAQASLVDSGIQRRATRCETLISRYKNQFLDNQPELLAQAERLENALLQVQRDTYRYFDLFDSRLVDRMTKNLALSRGLLKTMENQASSATRLENLTHITASLNDYQSAILEAVQRTRGYLYLVDVVMAAEAYEILYQSEQLATDLREEMGVIKARMAQRIAEAGQLLLWTSLIILIAVLTLGYRLGHSIAKPIERMANTFRRLANGETVAPIDRYASSDELSELARAAQVFKEKNAQTQSLLLQYQKLSSELEDRVIERTRALELANIKLEALSHTDSLTGLANRRCFDESIATEWAASERSGSPLAVIMLDVDFFKSYNDSYGHQAGDACLQEIATAIKDNLMRKTDLAARYGGEEYILILRDTDSEAAKAIAEKLREAVFDRQVTNPQSPFGVVTVSAGVAVHTPGDGIANCSELVRIADEALYESKWIRRNMVTFKTP